MVLKRAAFAGTVRLFVASRATVAAIVRGLFRDCNAAVLGIVLLTVAISATLAGTVLLTGWLSEAVLGMVLLKVLAIAAVAGIVRAMPACDSAAVAGTVLDMVDCSAAVLVIVRVSVDWRAAVAGTVRETVVADGVKVEVVTSMSDATPTVPLLEIKLVGLSPPTFALLSCHHRST